VVGKNPVVVVEAAIGVVDIVELSRAMVIIIDVVLINFGITVGTVTFNNVGFNNSSSFVCKT
jgi:hypothetical protein